MPKIDEVLGVIFIIHSGREHPPPHVHVKYKHYEATLDIKTGDYLKESHSKLPPIAYKIAKKWISQNRENVLKQWERMENGEQVLAKPKWR
jgi:hypothetical protein